MEQNNQNQSAQPIEHKKVGPIVVTLVVVLVLVIVALYIFASKISQQNPLDMTNADGDVPTTTQSQPAAVQAVPTVTGTSTDVQSLQNDLNTSVNGVDNQNF